MLCCTSMDGVISSMSWVWDQKYSLHFTFQFSTHTCSRDWYSLKYCIYANISCTYFPKLHPLKLGCGLLESILWQGHGSVLGLVRKFIIVFDIEKQWKYFNNSEYISNCVTKEWMNETEWIVTGKMTVWIVASLSVFRQWSE
jgi:hypothetical protein